MQRGFFVPIIMGLALVGCSSGELATHPRVVSPGVASADRALDAAIASVDRAMAQLQPKFEAPVVTAEPADQSKVQARQAAPYIPGELRRPVDVNMSEVDLEQAASILANYAGYHLIVSNPDRLPAVSISLVGTRRPLIDLFTSLGSQGGARIDVLVNADSRIVKLTYNKEANHA